MLSGLADKKIFYGWWMVGAATGLQFPQAGLVTQAFGAYRGPRRAGLEQDRAVGRGGAAADGSRAARPGPRLADRPLRPESLRARRRGGVRHRSVPALAGATLPTFYGAFIVIALGSSLCGFFPLNVALIHWFERKRARALSAMSIGLRLRRHHGAARGAVAHHVGWRATALASARLRSRRAAACHGDQQPARARRSGGWHANRSFSDEYFFDKTDSTRDFTAREALRTRSG